MIEVKPFLDGKGPTMEIDLINGSIWAQWGGESHEVFEWNPDHYNPGMGCTSDIHEADDILNFAMSYAERSEEFERDPEDLDQVWSVFWAFYGESFAYDIADQVEQIDLES